MVIILSCFGSFNASWASSSPPGYSQFPCGYFKDCAQTIIINGTSYSILYNIIGEPYGDPEGVKVTNIIANTELRAVSMQMETNQNGAFRIQIPRGAFAALGLERDADLVVLADGKNITSGHAMGDQTVMLGGNFTKGTREILIGDARTIPEFGNIAFLVSSIAIVGVMIVSRKRFQIVYEARVS